MHDPELLILDEPTVGVDPLLRQSIWNHLVQITKDGDKTVIITTHYIEEARQAHTVSSTRRCLSL
jgi:ABC-type multidrug transport system ATPase subunit